MRDHLFNNALTRLSALFLLAFLLAACSEGTPPSAPAAAVPPSNTPPALPPSLIALGTSTNFILNDNATAATLTATLVDSSNAVMPGVYVSFSTTTGSLNASSVMTDANGQATVLLTSGLFDMTNRTATVTASVSGQSASIPIVIQGSTLALATSPTTTIMVGAGTIDVTATAKSAKNLGVANQTVRFSIGAASTGSGTLSAVTRTTDAFGVTSPSVTFTPTVAGNVVLTAEWLNSIGAVTATATRNITVEAALGVAFAITVPPADPFAMTASTSAVPSTQSLAATVPDTIGGVAVTSVRITATAGTWTGTNPAAGPASSILQTPSGPVGGKAVAATYTAPTSAGSVTVQADALNASGAVLSTVTRTFLVSASTTSAARIFLSASQSTIPPSSGTNISTLTLEVTVRDANNNSVGFAPVLFGLIGTTGSGESVAPAVVYTDSMGVATTTFTAGTAPTLGAIYAQARMTGQTCTGSMPDPTLNETNKLCDSTKLIVASKAVGIAVGFGSKIESVELNTQYRLPGSVTVVDSNGSGVAGVPVTLTVYPIEYRNGLIMSGRVYNGAAWLWQCVGPFNTNTTPTWDPIYLRWIYNIETEFTPAEDVNRNGIMDTGEETVGNGVLDLVNEDTNANGLLDAGEDLNGNNLLDYFEDKNNNNILDPGEDAPNSGLARAAQAISSNGLLSPSAADGGTVPMTVTTDSKGVATFYLQYQKSSAWFIKDEVTARVIVMGTESVAKTTIALPMSETDNLAPTCPLSREGSF